MRVRWLLFVCLFFAYIFVCYQAGAAENILNFRPYETLPLNAGTSSSSVKFQLPQSAAMEDVLVSNAGTVIVFVAYGTGSAQAQLPGTGGTLGATPVFPGWGLLISKGQADTVAAITASGTSQLYITSGRGN